MSARWLFGGTLAVLGADLLATRGMVALGLQGVAAAILADVLAAGTAGALMLLHAPLRPRREPLVAGVVAIGLLVAVLFALSQGSWDGPDDVEEWAFTGLLAAVSGLAASLAATGVRRLAPAPGPMAVVALGLLVSNGFLTLVVAVLGALGAPEPVGVFMIFPCAFVGGAITQALVAARNATASGLGIAMLALLLLASRSEIDVETVFGFLFFACIVAALGAWGARVVWRRRLRRGTASEASLPVARVET